MYIAFSGVDGCGKDTQADMLFSYLLEKGLDPLRVAEPWEEAPTGKLLRQLLATGEHPMAHAALFLADRLALQAALIKPALDQGRPVISVRSFACTLAYQTEQWDLDWLVEIHKRMLVVPDVMVLLDMPGEAGLERVKARELDLEHYETDSVQQRVRKRYLNLWLYPDVMDGIVYSTSCHFQIVDATQSRDRVHEQILSELRAKGICP